MFKIKPELIQAIINYISVNSTGNVSFGQAYQIVAQLQQLEKIKEETEVKE